MGCKPSNSACAHPELQSKQKKLSPFYKAHSRKLPSSRTRNNAAQPSIKCANPGSLDLGIESCIQVQDERGFRKITRK